MKSFALCDPVTGDILSVCEVPDDQLPPEGEAPDGSGLHIIHGIADPDQDEIKNGRIRRRHWRTRQKERNDAAWGQLRGERHRRLAESDWTQMPDAPLTEAQKRVWTAYRQALRDLPSNTDDPASPDWPQEPI
jgi:hypothetical protein